MTNTARLAAILPAALTATTLAQMPAPAQIPDPEDWSDPAAVIDYYLEAADTEPTKLLLLGTFHFDDQGLDSYKPQHSFDPLEPHRLEEIEAVVQQLTKLNPDEVCIERRWNRQDSVNTWYDAYREGTAEQTRNEIEHIGFALAQATGLEQVRAIDAGGAWLEPRIDPQAYAVQNDQIAELIPPHAPAAMAYQLAEDRFIDRAHLTDIFRFLNNDRVLDVSGATYLIGSFGVGQDDEYPGVDGFVTHWYNRNLRIFQNIRRVSEPGETVVVLIGAGHVPILRHLAEISVEFELISVEDALAPADH